MGIRMMDRFALLAAAFCLLLPLMSVSGLEAASLREKKSLNPNWKLTLEEVKKLEGAAPLEELLPQADDEDSVPVGLLAYKVRMFGLPTRLDYAFAGSALNLSEIHLGFDNDALTAEKAKTAISGMEQMLGGIFQTEAVVRKKGGKIATMEEFEAIEHDAGDKIPKWGGVYMSIWSKDDSYAVLSYLTVDFETETGDKAVPTMLGLDVLDKNASSNMAVIEYWEEISKREQSGEGLSVTNGETR